MNIYIYGNSNFRKTIHSEFDHANLKFKLDGQSKIVEVKTKKELERLLKEEPDAIYLIDDWKIIRRNLVFWKFLCMFNFLLPSDAIEEDTLLSNGISDIVLHSIDELPQIILSKNKDKYAEKEKERASRETIKNIEEPIKDTDEKIEEPTQNIAEPIEEIEEKPQEPIKKRETKVDLNFDKIEEDYRLQNELNILLSPKEKNKDESEFLNNKIEEEKFDESEPYNYEEDDEYGEKVESFDEAIGFDDEDEQPITQNKAVIDVEDRLNKMQDEQRKKQQEIKKRKESEKEERIPYDFLATKENSEANEIEEEIKFFDALNIEQLDEIEMTNEDFINVQTKSTNIEEEEDYFENFVDLSSLDGLDENELNNAFSSK